MRILSATHHDLERMVEEGTFRQDLYYRINIMQIHLPPLSERAEDIPLLIEHFIRRFRHATGKAIESMTAGALATLAGYSFPGNVRELENIVERAFILCQGPVIDFDHLPSNVRSNLKGNPTAPRPWPSGLGAGSGGNDNVSGSGDVSGSRSGIALHPGRQMLNLVERDAIAASLHRHQGNRTHTARELGIHRSTLIRKLKRYGLG